jgi:hypothetical protein
VPESEFPDYAANALCEAYGKCCSSANVPFALKSCRTEARNSYSSHSICREGRQYDPTKVAACFQGLLEGGFICPSNSGKGTLDSRYVLPRACRQICGGTLPLGAACRVESDCAPLEGARVGCGAPEALGIPMTCRRQTRGKLGDGCFETCFDMQHPTAELRCSAAGSSESFTFREEPASCYHNDGLFCGSDRTCKKLIPLGERCTAGEFCAQSALCDSTTATCRLPIAAGSPCESHIKCDASTFCSSAGTCEAQKADGDACESDDECEHACNLDTQRCIFDAEKYVSGMTAACARPWETGFQLFWPL